MLSEESMELLIPASWVWITSWVQLCFPDGSDGKESACNTETQVWSLGQEDPLKKGLATHSRILAWRFSWTEEPGGLQPMGLQRVRHKWAITTNIQYIFTEQMNKYYSKDKYQMISDCYHLAFICFILKRWFWIVISSEYLHIAFPLSIWDHGGCSPATDPFPESSSAFPCTLLFQFSHS